MSVITGIYQYHRVPFALEDSRQLMEGLQRYQADDMGIWQDESIFMGCRHRSITPESRFERLPLHDKTSQLSIVSDSILDNRDELFDSLMIEYKERAAMTDSELILEAYLKWGQEAPAYFVGDFTFVIWDNINRQLFGARDPLGNRTLYYTDETQRFVFCTAIAPLLTLSGMKKRINETWLSEFLTIPLMLESTDSFSTVYEGILQIPPAHRIMVKNGNVVLTRYGSLIPTEKLRLRSDSDYDEAFHDVFQQAVNAKLRTNREVGASLSGGLDSGAVVSFAARQLRTTGKVLHTYSYVPSDDFVDWTSGGLLPDERPYIQETVRHVGNINDQYLNFPNQDPFSAIDELLDIKEMPYKTFENLFWIKGIYAQAEQQGIGVLLTGAQGNHTISWGSAINYYSKLLRRMQWVKLHRELLLFSRRVRMGRSRLLPIIGRLAVSSLVPASLAPFEADFPSMIHPAFAERTGVWDRLKDEDIGLNHSRVDEWKYREHHFNNPSIMNLIGSTGSQLSHRYGLWERDPTADHRVIRFCLSLPVEQYVRNGLDRAMVRRLTQHYLPNSVRLNQRVRGIQGADWIHRMRPHWSQFLSELQLLCRDSIVEGLLDIEQIKKSLAVIGETPRPELAYDSDARFLMRCLIVYRFLKRF